ncbi:LOB domain-containing protein 24-like [Magnolia sinica]|uniref:LOB domain-containing protein 24-like n=1 Tax=Magnolia sinica TaxID=86752 RepID=UPI00265B2FE4|nr:LOB domain-containing protein 24-like [Magnolia sinica]
MSAYNRCAACKSLRRRCPEDCIFAPYFPSTHPERFASVHMIYGASNVSKMLQFLSFEQQVPVHLRQQAADSMSLEAHLRVQDPIYGCVGIISQLQHEINMIQYELSRSQAQMALYDIHWVEQAPVQLQSGPQHDVYANRFNLTMAHQAQVAFYEQAQPPAEMDWNQLHHGEASSFNANQQDPMLKFDQL